MSLLPRPLSFPLQLAWQCQGGILPSYLCRARTKFPYSWSSWTPNSEGPVRYPQHGPFLWTSKEECDPLCQDATDCQSQNVWSSLASVITTLRDASFPRLRNAPTGCRAYSACLGLGCLPHRSRRPAPTLSTSHCTGPQREGKYAFSLPPGKPLTETLLFLFPASHAHPEPVTGKPNTKPVLIPRASWAHIIKEKGNGVETGNPQCHGS